MFNRPKVTKDTAQHVLGWIGVVGLVIWMIIMSGQ